MVQLIQGLEFTLCTLYDTFLRNKYPTSLTEHIIIVFLTYLCELLQKLVCTYHVHGDVTSKFVLKFRNKIYIIKIF